MSAKSPNPIDVEVGSRVRALRIAARMSQENLGDALGITFQQIQKYEKGSNRISASKLKQIADVLGVRIGDLFAPDDDGEGPREAVSFLAGLSSADIDLIKSICALTPEAKQGVRKIVEAVAEATGV